MWLLNSSIGKKLIMSISGLFLVLFLLFHLSMNVAAVFSGEAYNMVCSLLGCGKHVIMLLLLPIRHWKVWMLWVILIMSRPSVVRH